jgi:hypothetical protein
MEALEQISIWADTGRPLVSVAAGALLVACFVVFNAVRVFLYLPQLVSCWRDAGGCAGVNLVTWSSWIAANTSTGLYMWVFMGDAWGLIVNLGSALMCAATVAVTVVKRKRRARASALRHLPMTLHVAAPKARAALSSTPHPRST